MDLSIFKTIDEKKSAYDYIQVDSFSEVLDYFTLKQANPPQRTYFRGQADGSWKLYSSMQREWQIRELCHRFNSYSEMTSAFLEYAKEFYSLQLKAYCKAFTDISIISVLQHYGAPTPFIDWTSNYKVALYFASQTDGLCCGNETSSFISIYSLNIGQGAETPNNDLTSFSKLILMAKNLGGEIEEALKDVSNSMVGKNFEEQWIESATRYDFWKQYELWMEETDDYFMKISNPRSDLQSGSFLYSKEVDQSLDKLFEGTKVTDGKCESSKTLHLDSFDNNYWNPSSKPKYYTENESEPQCFLPKIQCLDIHKSVVPQIKEYLKDCNITKQSLGLDSDEWGKNIFASFLGKYNTNQSNHTKEA